MAGESQQHARRWARWLPAAVIAVVVAAGMAWALLSLRDEPDIPRIQPREDKAASAKPLERPKAPPHDYIGSRACAKCHRAIYESYQSHPMAHSAGPMQSIPAIEDDSNVTSFSVPGGYRYQVRRTPQGVFHHESKQDANGKTIYDQAMRVHYAIGSGKRGRSYVIDHGGLHFESPITWYSGRQRWDLSPGYEPGEHQRFERRISFACISCHAGLVRRHAEQSMKFQQPAFQEYVIGCERCHGPGQRHADFHETGGVAGRSDPIVNPMKLPSREREAVCYQCHLHGEERIPRYGRGHFDFRPGMKVEDVWAVFVRGDRIGDDGRTKAVSHVEQMRQSVCYQKSGGPGGMRRRERIQHGGRMNCVSCHDPHMSPAPADRVAFYRRKCQQCHQGNDTVGCSVPLKTRMDSTSRNSCIQCHMPKLQASDVPHTSQTDHRVLKKPGEAQRTGQPAGQLVLFDRAAERLPELAVSRAQALYTILHTNPRTQRAYAREAIDRLETVLKAAPDDVDSLLALAAAYSTIDKPAKAREHLKRALQLQPKNEMALAALVTLEHKAGNDGAGLKTLNRLLEINPHRAEYYGRKAHMLGRLRKFDSAIVAAKKALELNPEMQNVHAWLVETYRYLGKAGQSERHADTLRRLKQLKPGSR